MSCVLQDIFTSPIKHMRAHTHTYTHTQKHTHTPEARGMFVSSACAPGHLSEDFKKEQVN